METDPHCPSEPTEEESGGYRIQYQRLNGSSKTRVTVTELSSGRKAFEEIRPNAIGGSIRSIRETLIRQLQRG